MTENLLRFDRDDAVVELLAVEAVDMTDARLLANRGLLRQILKPLNCEAKSHRECDDSPFPLRSSRSKGSFGGGLGGLRSVIIYLF